MKHSSHLFGLCLVLMGLALCLCAGCGGAKAVKIEPPDPAALEAALEGQTLTVEGKDIKITKARVSGFQMLQVHSGPEGKSGSVTVSFEYALGTARYKVNGVVSYVRPAPGQIESPHFEAVEVKR